MDDALGHFSNRTRFSRDSTFLLFVEFTASIAITTRARGEGTIWCFAIRTGFLLLSAVLAIVTMIASTGGNRRFAAPIGETCPRKGHQGLATSVRLDIAFSRLIHVASIVNVERVWGGGGI